MKLSIGRLSACCLTLLFALPLPVDARPKIDSVVVLNGDRVTGEIKGMENGILRYGTDSLGTVNIEWTEVVQLDSNYLFRVRTEQGIRYFGAIGHGDEPGTLRIIHAEGEEVYPIMEIVAIAPIDSTLSERLDTVISAGFSDFKASESSNTRLELTMTYEDELSVNKLNARSLVADNSGETNTSQLVRLSRAKLWENPRYFNYYDTSWDSNDQLGIDSRLTLGYGIGRHIFDNNKTKLSFIVGLQALTEEDSEGDSNESLEGLLATNYRVWRFSDPELNLVSALRVYPGITESGRLRAEGEITLSWEIINDLNLNLTAFGSLDNESSRDGDDYDYGITTGIEWEL